MLLVLASTSPARLATLRSAGLDPATIAPGVDEEASVAAAERQGGRLTAPDMVQLLARLKAEAVIPRVAAMAAADPALEECLVLGGDSAFEVDGVIYGKPHLAAVARQRWQNQRGRTGVLHSGHWLIAVNAGRVSAATGEASAASVTLADDLEDAEIDAYIATGEPLTVAGAFTIDGRGGAFVTRIEGDPGTVVGLSVPLLRRLTRRLGVPWTSLWSR